MTYFCSSKSFAMRNIFFGIGLVSILVACSSSTTDATVAVADKDDAPKEVIANVVPNRMLTVDIDGMVCQMGCGSSIRKELKATNGVGDCSFDFEDGRPTNTATIEFDKEVITADEITTIISEINDGQFTVGTSNAAPLKKPSDDSAELDPSSSTTEENTAVTMTSTSGYQMPNFLDIFSNLLTH